VTPPDGPFAPPRSGARRRPGRWAATLGVVFLGGAIGTSVRYAIVTTWGPASSAAFPAATLAINLAGAFAVGLLLTLILEHWPPTRYARAFGAIGVLGGFTTFSSFVVETDRLLAAGRVAMALTYLAATLAAGIVACAAGAAAAGAWPRLARRRAG
jgi:CrcB protein